jgi:hypothetical protein
VGSMVSRSVLSLDIIIVTSFTIRIYYDSHCYHTHPLIDDSGSDAGPYLAMTQMQYSSDTIIASSVDDHFFLRL